MDVESERKREREGGRGREGNGGREGKGENGIRKEGVNNTI